MSEEDTLRILHNPDKGQERVRVKFQEGLGGLSGYLAGFQTDSIADDTIHLVESTENQNLTHISK